MRSSIDITQAVVILKIVESDNDSDNPKSSNTDKPIEVVLFGDVNCDVEVDSADALDVLRYSVQLSANR